MHALSWSSESIISKTCICLKLAKAWIHIVYAYVYIPKILRCTHYRRSFLCRVPATHGEIGKAHGKYCAVCLLSANNTRQRTPRRISYAVCIYQNPRRNICRVLPPHARESKAPNSFPTSTEDRGGLGVQFAVGLEFAVCLLFAVCRALCYAVCLLLADCRVPSLSRLPWARVCRVPCLRSLPCALLCRVPHFPGWQQVSSQESTGGRRVACLPCASTRHRTYGFIAVC
jgi:hypothetical protein